MAIVSGKDRNIRVNKRTMRMSRSMPGILMAIRASFVEKIRRKSECANIILQLT